MHNLTQSYFQKKVRPRTRAADYIRHAYREHNAEADRLAGLHCMQIWLEPNFALEQYWYRRGKITAAGFFRAYFDGSKGDHSAGAGWAIYKAKAMPNWEDLPENWDIIARASIYLDPIYSVLQCETAALYGAMRAVGAVLECRLDRFVEDGEWQATTQELG